MYNKGEHDLWKTEDSIPYLTGLADSFDHWMKTNNNSGTSDTDSLLNWLYADYEQKEIKNEEHFCKLIKILIARGYAINPLLSKNEVYQAFKKAETNLEEKMPPHVQPYKHYPSFFDNEYDLRRSNIKEKLEQSAFRQGISTGLQGLMKIGPSDHLPITVNFNGILMVSWNLLSDQHLKNFIFDIAQKEHFVTNSLRSDGKKINWRSFLQSFGAFIKKNLIEGPESYQIKITRELFENFLQEHYLTLIELKTTTDEINQIQKQIETTDELIKDTEEVIKLWLNTDHEDHEDFKISMKHIVEIIYSMNYGCLRWTERFNRIKENKALLHKFVSHDFFCFQECTNPTDMLELLQTFSESIFLNKNYQMICYRVGETSKDNCVIIYDKNKFHLLESMNFGLAFNRNTHQYLKPCLVAKFISLIDKKSVVVGSIHHPGTRGSELSSIMEKAYCLAENSEKSFTPTIILGDFNHQANFFEKDLVNSNYTLIMPATGTMAGFEYGNNNMPIDGALTNDTSNVQVRTIKEISFAEPVMLPLSIEFLFEENAANDCLRRL